MPWGLLISKIGGKRLQVSITAFFIYCASNSWSSLLLLNVKRIGEFQKKINESNFIIITFCAAEINNF